MKNLLSAKLGAWKIWTLKRLEWIRDHTAYKNKSKKVTKNKNECKPDKSRRLGNKKKQTLKGVLEK